MTGTMGFALGNFIRCLKTLGVREANVRAITVEIEHIVRTSTKEIWDTRCKGRRRRDGEQGITDDVKRNGHQLVREEGDVEQTRTRRERNLINAQHKTTTHTWIPHDQAKLGPRLRPEGESTPNIHSTVL